MLNDCSCYGLFIPFPWSQDGRLPAEYQKSRDGHEILRMLHDARTLDAHGNVG
jgi:hypothetical protein